MKLLNKITFYFIFCVTICISILSIGCKTETSAISPLAFLGLTSQAGPGWYAFIGAPTGGSSYDRPNSVMPTGDGGFIFSGFSSFNIPTLQSKTPVNAYSAGIDILVVKTDSTGNVAWYTFLGGTGSNYGKSVQQTSDGGYIVAGNADNNIASLQTKTPVNAYSSGTDMFLIKLDSNGSVSWYTFLGGSGWDNGNSVKQTSDGGYIVAGSAGANIASLNAKTPLNSYSADSDMLVIKLDSTGNVTWYTFLGGTGYDYANSVGQTSDGGYIIAGAATANIAALQTKTPLNAYSTGYDMFLVKLNSSGNTDWYTFIGSSGTDEASSVQQTSDGGYIVAGAAGANIAPLQSISAPLNAYAAALDWMVVKLNSSGNAAWYTFFGTSANEQAYSICQTSDHGFIVAGYAGTNIPTLGTITPLNAFTGGSDMMLVRLNASGNVGWYTFLGGSGSDYAHNVQQAPDGGFIVAGSADADIPSLMTLSPVVAFNDNDDWCLIKLRPDGSM